MTSALRGDFPRATFRDPAGSLSFEAECVVRRIDASARAEVLDLLDMPFFAAMQARGDLVGTEVDDSGHALSLRHPRIAFPSYPWEWTRSQWLDAAELTLDLCEQALAEGWILKDATPLNVLFRGARPVFVDVLSFERRDPHSSIWLAYGQYVRTFLLPLLMNRMLSWPLALSLFKRDGYEPADCYAALNWSQRLGRDAFWPITLPALLDRRQQKQPVEKKPAVRVQDAEVTANVLRRMLRNLRKRTQRSAAVSGTSEWSEYQSRLAHYTPEQSRDKAEWVRGVLAKTQAATVLDIGANTGEFSAMAAETGATVVALERDPPAADRIHRMASERKLSIQTICADLARPTPAVGWENAESVALLPRLEERFDVVLMLAVIHHLILMEQIPLAAIAQLCHRLTQRYLVVEWVPPGDPMYQSLMRGRDELYGSLGEEDLLAACAGLFHAIDRHPLENGRMLILLEKTRQEAN